MKSKFIWMPFLFLVLAVAITALVMVLWNWLMPALFGLSIITFWQALGILVLSKILFGGHWGKNKGCCHGGHNHYAWKEKFKSKWQNMSDEERQKWESKWGSCGIGKSDTKTNA